MLPVLLSGLAGLAALRGTKAADVITEDSYFYGQSPPSYPSPNMTGTGPWATAYSKAAALVAQMTLEEKVNLTAGTTADNGCSGTIPAVERLGFPGLCLSDAGNGLRATDFVNSWPSGIHVGASWNKALTKQRAMGMGGEFKTKGVNVLLGPVVGPMGRVTSGGRNWEGFSIDPYLSGQLVYETVTGVQGVGVITSTKHYIGNEQEENRNPVGKIASVSSNIDDKTMHEFYLWPFADAVKAGTGNIMCSYNRLNNSYGCQNSHTLNGLLKTELGFQGFVVSDWFAQHSGVASALAGLDMAMPNGGIYWGRNLTLAVTNGSVPEYRIDDMATRIIAPWYQMNQDTDFPTLGIGMPANINEPHEIIDARQKSSQKILFDGAVEGHVLVKNENNALPLKEPRMLSLFGYDAPIWDVYGSSGSLDSWAFGAEPVSFQEVIGGFTNANTSHSAIGINGTMIFGGGSGAGTPPYISSPFEAISTRCQDDMTALFWDFANVKPHVNGNSDACIVSVNAWATEGYDRPGLYDDYTDVLINNVADKCNNTIVVFHNAGVRLVDGFVDHPNVTAIIFGHLPGQDSGKALVSLLYGESNPSGKLPYTVAKNESDYGAVVTHSLPEGEYALFPQSDFDEGVFVDYRHFDANNITPRYEFGFGLSYTTFEYSNLVIDAIDGAVTDEYPSGVIVEGGHEDLWDVVATVSATVSNTGDVDGMEVAQLYVSIPGTNEPVRVLRGFEKPMISAGGSATVQFDLTRRDLSSWDVEAQMWKLTGGSYGIAVGSSSRVLPLTGTLEI